MLELLAKRLLDDEDWCASDGCWVLGEVVAEGYSIWSRLRKESISGSKEVFRWDILMIDQSGEQDESDRKVRNWVLPKIVLAFWQHCCCRLVTGGILNGFKSVDSGPATS